MASNVISRDLITVIAQEMSCAVGRSYLGAADGRGFPLCNELQLAILGELDRDAARGRGGSIPRRSRQELKRLCLRVATGGWGEHLSPSPQMKAEKVYDIAQRKRSQRAGSEHQHEEPLRLSLVGYGRSIFLNPLLVPIDNLTALHTLGRWFQR